MNGVSLFSGGGIGELVFKQIFPDYRTIAYVEWDKKCHELLRQRIKDGLLDDAPIFGDIRHFNERYASRFTGKVDWLSGGFPCQPFSSAGNRLGEADKRNMWPATRDAIDVLRPRNFLLENVPNIVSFPIYPTILSDITTMRYDSEWDIVSAQFVGRPIIRRRWWLLGHDKCRIRNRVFHEQGASLSVPVWDDTEQDDLSNVETSWLVANGMGIGVRDGLAKRMERCGHIIGNGWCPQVVARILEVTAHRADGDGD